MLTEEDIDKVNKNLDSNKAHGHDMISIRTLKICGKSIIKFLHITYTVAKKGCLPDEWKKTNNVLVHRKS